MLAKVERLERCMLFRGRRPGDLAGGKEREQRGGTDRDALWRERRVGEEGGRG